jgi:hypothetical protein
MLVICNGTFKSGSSWLHAIILQLLKVKKVELTEIPDKYNPNLKSPTRILEYHLQAFIRNEDCKRNNFVTKAHFFSNNTLQYKYKDCVKFIFIERDIKDAIVSHFFHFNNFRKTEFSFNSYFNVIGVFKAYEIYLFNKRCRRNFQNHLFFSFESLKFDFSESVKFLSKTLGLGGLSEIELHSIKNNTSLETMRKTSKEGESKYYPELGNVSHKLFRKGNIGDWESFFKNKQLVVINKIINGQASIYIRICYFVFFTIRRKIGL